MRKLIYGMKMNLDGYIAVPGDEIGWSGPPSDELFQCWLDRERGSGLILYGRKLWEGGVLLDHQQSRMEHPPGHRRRGHRDPPAQA